MGAPLLCPSDSVEPDESLMRNLSTVSRKHVYSDHWLNFEIHSDQLSEFSA